MSSTTPTDRYVPRATYRVQLHAGFTLDDTAAIVDYLDELGISDLYCSPYLQARPGSMHGYDVVNHRRISVELGGEQAHARMVDALAERGMGHVLDVVPNHMTVAERANHWWWEVLRNGRSSQFAPYFDIEWEPHGEKLDRKVLVPILADHYGRVLENGELELALDQGEVVVRYYDHVYPISLVSLEGVRGYDVPIQEVIARINADVEALHDLLEQQHYRLALWKTAGYELNYRRFFAINDLVALRMENPMVFDHVHELVLSLIDQGRLQGLRIDHIDGLREPDTYLARLRHEAGNAYIVVEKILESEEELPHWPVEGTTGYEFLNVVGGVFIDPNGEKPITEVYENFTGESADIEGQRHAAKLLMMRTELATDLDRLTDLFQHVCELHRRHRDFTRFELRHSLAETIAAFPVYRTYVNVRTGSVTSQDERWVVEATETARGRRPDLDPELFSFLADLLLLRIEGSSEGELAMRFQQISGPVMAKGVEDTLFYRFNRLVSLNEVGGDPTRFGIAPDEFHRLMIRAQEKWPHSMLTTSTHDTKRSEDIRARIGLLSEIPERWGDALERFSEHAQRHRKGRDPSRDDEYLMFQTLVGAWPISTDRMVEFMAKSAKEAKAHTSWIDPNVEYDTALESFVRSVMDDERLMEQIGEFVRPLVHPGWVTSMAQTLIKLTAPGMPDVYQGQELWDLSLVDPDNRRPVDFDHRRRLLSELRNASPEQAWAEVDAGGPKLYVTMRALRARRRRPEPFLGPYEPLTVTGSKAQHAVGFCRSGEVVTIVPRLVLSIGGEWDDTTVRLPEGRWRDEFTGDSFDGRDIPLGYLLSRFQVALLTRERSAR
ncbi:MAG: malto-oligosyltrehalose synthase [Actinomycetota bacterium]